MTAGFIIGSFFAGLGVSAVASLIAAALGPSS